MSGRGGAALTLPTTRDGRPILSRADLQAYDPRPGRSGGRERYYCPVHGGDHQRSLVVDPATGKFTCHSCGAQGTLREHWPEADGTSKSPKPVPTPTLAELGRIDIAAWQRLNEERAERLAGDLPAAAVAFLAQLPALQEALRAPDCPGALYLRGRGLDPQLAAELGAGYAPPNSWPGDHGRRVGRIVYPLADPCSGRVVSALGRLCVDADPAWSETVAADFKEKKQRKLTGCPAGVWPYLSIAEARSSGRPLVMVEGPADALALLQRAPEDLQVLALIGTANVLPAAALEGLPGVVLALDGDDGGSKGTRALRTDLALAGVRSTTLPAGWLGTRGAKDPADLAQAAYRARISDTDDSSDRALTLLEHYTGAIAAVQAGCTSLLAPVVQPSPWDDDAAIVLLASMYGRIAVVYDTASEPSLSHTETLDQAMDAACEARDWGALERAAAAYERAVLGQLGR